MTNAAQDVPQARIARFAGAMYLIQVATGVLTQGLLLKGVSSASETKRDVRA
jgi:hypothetical protein